MRTFLRSFAGGEVTPELFARGDQTGFQTGLSRAQNFITLPHGPARNRPGTEHTLPTKNGIAMATRLVEFTFSTTQTYALEFSADATPGNGYVRFFSNNVPIMVADGPAPQAWNGLKSLTNIQVSPTNTLDTTVAHGWATGDEVTLNLISGSVPPSGLAAFAVYFVIVVDSNTIQLATTLANALAGVATPINGVGAGVLGMSKVYRKRTLVTFGGDSYYCNVDSPLGAVPDAITPLTSSMSAATNEITATAHGYYRGTAVVVRANGGTLPPELTDGMIVYALPTGSNTLQVAASYGSGTAIDFTVNSTGNPTVERLDHWHLQTDDIYEIPHPFTDAELPLLRYWQSNDVMTLTKADRGARLLRRFGLTDWSLDLAAFVPALTAPVLSSIAATQVGQQVAITLAPGSAPVRLQSPNNNPWQNGQTIRGSVIWTVPGTGVSGNFRAVNISGTEFDLVNVDGTNVTPPGGATTAATGSFQAVTIESDSNNSYQVTAVDTEGNESLPSNVQSNTNNLFADGAYNTLTWSAVVGAASYRVYKILNGLYGLIGRTPAGVVTFKDDNIAPDLAENPPRVDGGFNVPGAFPVAGCYHEQRKVFGQNQTVWATRPGTEGDMSYSIPVKPDDRLLFGIAATEFSQIMHMVSMGDLIVLTTSTEFAVTSPEDAVLTPTSIQVQAQEFNGAGLARPRTLRNTLVYAAARGGHLRDLFFQTTAGGFVTRDLSLRATHLFDNLTIVDIAVSKSPYPIVWVVSSNGKLLGLTYIPDQEVFGWHQHSFGEDVFVESIACIAEGNEDRLYLSVRCTTVLGPTRHIMRMSALANVPVEESKFLDNAKTVLSPVAGTVGGFTHLAGWTVHILADGIVLPPQIVDALGQITIPQNFSRIHVGRPIDAWIETLPLFMQIDGLGQGHQKNVTEVYVRTVNSAPFWVGPSLDSLVPSLNTAPSVRGLMVAETLVPHQRETILVNGDWTPDAQLVIRQRAPLPLTVAGLTLKTAV